MLSSSWKGEQRNLGENSAKIGLVPCERVQRSVYIVRTPEKSPGMAGGLKMLLVDTNVWLERLLDQEKSDEVGRFLDAISSEQLFITDFARQL